MSNSFRNSGDSASKQGHLSVATSYVAGCWFPCVPAALSALKNWYENQDSQTPLSTLIQADPALLTAFMQLTQQGPTPSFQTSDINERWSRLNPNSQSNLLKSIEKLVTHHPFTATTQAQGVRLQECIVSATTAQTLATAIDPTLSNETWLSALTRQLGLNLIAWNYPHIFNRAVAGLHGSASLDSSLARILGFSPTALAQSLVSNWGVSADILRAVGDRVVSLRGETIEHNARIGEALARATSSVKHPRQQEELEFARSSIEDTLGANGWRTIGQALEKSFKNFNAFSSRLFSFSERLKQQLTPPSTATEYATNTLTNEYAIGCTPAVIKELKLLYQMLAQGDYRGAQRHLITSAFITAGYQGAALTLNPKTKLLSIAHQIGDAAGFYFDGVSFTERSSPEIELIAKAYAQQRPLTGINSNAGRHEATIVIPLCEPRPEMILVLRRQLRSADESALTVDLKALRVAAEDILSHAS